MPAAQCQSSHLHWYCLAILIFRGTVSVQPLGPLSVPRYDTDLDASSVLSLIRLFLTRQAWHGKRT